jgi:choline dehydrogenase-like flavoprotein
MTVYDAIVVGSGAVGGWAAKELTEGGLSVLLLEAGPSVELRAALPEPTAMRQIAATGAAPPAGPEARARQPIQSRHWAYNAVTTPLFVDDLDNPYTTPSDRPFDWFRSRVIGGRTLLWGGMTPRMSSLELKTASREGYGADWPLTYEELAPFYARVEAFHHVHGAEDQLPQMPDGVFQPPMPLTGGEQRLKAAVERRWSERRVVPLRGIPAGIPCWLEHAVRAPEVWPAFTSQGSTLAAATQTGRLTVRPHSVVSHVEIDRDSGRARSVAYLDALTKQPGEARARVIVLAASTIESTRILLNSKSASHSAGLGNSSGLLGRYLMDHPPLWINGPATPLPGEKIDPRFGGPYGVCIPRFRNLTPGQADFVGGYGVWGTVHRGPIGFNFTLQCEMLPREENRVTLDEERRDAWGLPAARIDCTYSDNERNMARDGAQAMREMLGEVGLVPASEVQLAPPGSMIHEMGTARMGSDRRTSVLNSHNQCWDAPNVFVTDGACFPTGGWQNPTLTMCAITARACHYIIEQGKAQAL